MFCNYTRELLHRKALVYKLLNVYKVVRTIRKETTLTLFISKHLHIGG